MLHRLLKSPAMLSVLAGLSILLTLSIVTLITESLVNALIISTLLFLNLSFLISLARFWVFPRVNKSDDDLVLNEFDGRQEHQYRKDDKQFDHIAPQHPSAQSQNSISQEYETDSFTLGVASFEAPKPIDVPVQNNTMFYPPDQIQPSAFDEVTIARAYQKSTRPQSNKKERLLQRFYYVCRTLKQMNYEVAVWTEEELNTLANTMLELDSEDKDMIAVLLPQNVVRLKTQSALVTDHHAQLFQSLSQASGGVVSLNKIQSTKDKKTGKCELTFYYQQQPMVWRFLEEGNKLSDKFLAKACQWIGKRSNGRFAVLEDVGFRMSLVFIPQAVEQRLNEENATV